MSTITIHIPTSDVGWFEQMVQSMGWRMIKKVSSKTGVQTPKRVYEKEVDELLRMFKTDKISQEEVDKECELVREALYNAAQEN